MSEQDPSIPKPPEEKSDRTLGREADMGLHGLGALVEMMRRLRVSVETLDGNVSDLKECIEKGQRVETQLTWALFFLTIVITILTAVMAAPILISIWNRFL